jgi:hypothetical protein
MTQTQFFVWLGAPLVNVRWSWGSIRHDGVIFLRAWQDEVVRLEDARFIRITRHLAFAGDLRNRGYQERLAQIDHIRAGAKCYVVMCEPDKERLPERVIKDFNSDEVFATGRLREVDGDMFIELLARVAALSVRLGQAPAPRLPD